MSFIYLFIVFIYASLIWWVYFDATNKRGQNLGCMWTLVVIITFPLGLIGYLLVKDKD